MIPDWEALGAGRSASKRGYGIHGDKWDIFAAVTDSVWTLHVMGDVAPEGWKSPVWASVSKGNLTEDEAKEWACVLTMVASGWEFGPRYERVRLDDPAIHPTDCLYGQRLAPCDCDLRYEPLYRRVPEADR